MNEGRFLLCIGLFCGLGSCSLNVFQHHPDPPTVPKDLNHSQINMSINSGCNYKNCSVSVGGISLINSTVYNEPELNRTCRWMWSVVDYPVIQLAITDQRNPLLINWNAIFGIDPLEKSVRYRDKPLTATTVMLLNLIEFDDQTNSGVLNDQARQVIYPLSGFSWERVVLKDTKDIISVQLVAQNYTSAKKSPDKEKIFSGKINITFSGYSSSQLATWMPHLSQNDRTNQMDIQLDNLNTSSGFNATRFALQFITVSESDEKHFTRRATTCLDDQNTPGIFETNEALIAGNEASLQTYLQWKPVCYTSTKRDMSESTGVDVGIDVGVDHPSMYFNDTWLVALYGQDIDLLNVRSFNVSLGSKNDGFYQETNFLTWTFTLGAGQPVQPALSTGLIVVVGIMLGVLLTVFTISGIICVYKKCTTRNRVPFVRLQDQNGSSS